MAHPSSPSVRLVFALPLCLALLAFAACSQQPAPKTAAAAAEDGSASASSAPDTAAGASAADAAAAVPPAAEESRRRPAPGINQEIMRQAEGKDIVTDEDLRAALQPPDGRWLVDEEGRRYYVMTIPKIEGYYQKVEPGKVRIKPGLLFDVLREGEEDFDVKMYEPVIGGPPPVPQEPPAPVEVVEPATVDRLTFQAFDEGLPKEGQWRNGFTVADMNGDGHPDIVHGPARKGQMRPWIFLGDGEGHWRPWSEARFPRVGLDYGDTAVADFNGDGHADIAFASHLRGVMVMVGDGNGVFTTWSEGTGFANPEAHEGVASFSSRAIEAADWNGDGRPDLVALGEGPRLTGARAPNAVGGDLDTGAQGLVVFLNHGDGTWERLDHGVGRGHVFGDDLELADFDGDGRLEVLTSSGAFGRNDLLVSVDASGEWHRVALDGVPANAYSWSVATGDFDGDGHPDMAVGYQQKSSGNLLWHTGIDVMLNRGDGSWEPHTAISVPDESGVWSLAAGDIDADGHTDLLGVTGVGEVLVLLGNGDGTFEQEEVAAKIDLETCRGYHAELRDVDGRPGDEMLIGFAGEAGSEVMIPGLTRRCPSEGRIAVWRVRP